MEAPPTPRLSLDSLAFDILLIIFKRLDTRDVIRVGVVSIHPWHFLASLHQHLE
jgi:hypothetical protein